MGTLGIWRLLTTGVFVHPYLASAWRCHFHLHLFCSEIRGVSDPSPGCGSLGFRIKLRSVAKKSAQGMMEIVPWIFRPDSPVDSSEEYPIVPSGTFTSKN